jgi:hypothetical protein
MPYFEPQWTASGADAALLHAAEGGDLGRDDAFVDADDAVLPSSPNHSMKAAV